MTKFQLHAFLWPVRLNVRPKRRSAGRFFGLAFIACAMLVPTLRSQRPKPVRMLLPAPPAHLVRVAGGSGRGALDPPQQRASHPSKTRDRRVKARQRPTNNHQLLVAASKRTPGEALAGQGGEAGAGGVEEGSGVGQGSGGGNGEGDQHGESTGLLEPRPLPAQPKQRAWNCEWPPNKPNASASVVIRAWVDEDGFASSVEVLDSSDADFNATTVRCALAKRYHPARDIAGQAIKGHTEPWPIRYVVYGARTLIHNGEKLGAESIPAVE